MSLEFARLAPKFRLRGAIRFRNMATLRAFTAAVSRIHGDHGDASHDSLVLNEISKLRERPGMQNDTSLSPSRYPPENASEFFNGDSTVGAFGFRNDLLRNAMVNVGCESGFLASQFAEMPPSGTGAYSLELATGSPSAAADGSDKRARITITVGVTSDVNDAHVNADEIRRGGHDWNLYVATRYKIKAVAAKDEYGFSLSPGERIPVVRRADEGHSHAPSDCPDTHGVGEPAQNPSVVGNAAIFAKPAQRVGLVLVGVSYFRNRPNDNLGRQFRERLAGRVVPSVVNIVSPEYLASPSPNREPITARIGHANRLPQCSVLLFGALQFDVSGEDHCIDYIVSSREGE